MDGVCGPIPVVAQLLMSLSDVIFTTIVGTAHFDPLPLIRFLLCLNLIPVTQLLIYGKLNNEVVNKVICQVYVF